MVHAQRVCQTVVPGPAASASPENVLGMQRLGHYPKLMSHVLTSSLGESDEHCLRTTAQR